MASSAPALLDHALSSSLDIFDGRPFDHKGSARAARHGRRENTSSRFERG